MNGKSVLIIGLNYAPEQTGIAPYTTGMAESLVRNGYTVEVITSYPHYPSWFVSPESKMLPSVSVSAGVRLRRIRHYVPRRPKLLNRSLMEFHFGFRAIASRWGAADTLVLVSPSLFASALGILRARLFHREKKITVWVQDIYSAGLTETGGAGSKIARVLGLLEAFAFRSADSVCVIHERFARTVELMGVPPCNVKVVRNWNHFKVVTDGTGQKAEARRRLGWDTQKTVVLHAGNMGVKQGLENVIEAARLVDSSDMDIEFVLLGDGNQREDLESEATGIESLRFVRPLPDGQFADALKASDILLVNEKAGVVEMAVPSKLTTYFAAGRPVLACTNSASTTADVVAESGGGVVVGAGSPEILVSAVRQLRDDPNKMADLASRGLDYCAGQLSASQSEANFVAVLEELSRA
ncbi:glycosyltransferase family 4 protein [Williamsia muralis]|uniref:glycosyltransferase family 4 protein n=1 Tax=Williamsia marianensis TaxID=85044 RepID=UPI003809D849